MIDNNRHIICSALKWNTALITCVHFGFVLAAFIAYSSNTKQKHLNSNNYSKYYVLTIHVLLAVENYLVFNMQL